MRLGRGVVGTLGGVAALLAFLVGAVSLTRIAGDYLGFPVGLEWTLTGAVDVAGVAGGVMWTGFTGAVRKIGRPMSIVCTAVSGVGVGLDHSTHAGRALREPGADLALLPGGDVSWPWVAFAAGVFLPALVTWILHALAVIADSAAHWTDSDRQATHVAVGPTAPDRQPTHVVMAVDRQRATDSAAGFDRQPAPTAAKTAGPTAGTRPGIHAVPDPRPAWLTDALLARVVTAMRPIVAKGETYGAPRLMTEHPRDGHGNKLTRYKADAVLAHIRDHGLLRESA